MSVSCVCASDNTTATVISDNSPVTVDTGNSTIAVDADNEPVTVNVDNTVPGTYDNLNNDIHNIAPHSVYNITRDYKFDGKGQTIILKDRVIVISQDNIIINGNGHIIMQEDLKPSQYSRLWETT